MFILEGNIIIITGFNRVLVLFIVFVVHGILVFLNCEYRHTTPWTLDYVF